MSNPFAALEEVSEGSSNQSKKQEKKTEQPKTTPKVQEKPKETTQEKPKPKPKPQTDKPVSGVTQDGFEQVGKTQRGGRPQRGQSERGRGSGRGGRGGDRGTRGSSRGGRGGFTKPPRTDSNTGSEQTVVKDVREDQEKHVKKGEFRNERTGEPRQGNARGRGRFHDHHLSGTGTRGGMKKRGGGGHNWGTPKDDQVEVATEKEVEVATETTEEKKEEVIDPKNMTEEQKKAFRKKRKEAEKTQRKGVKKDDKSTEKSDELSIDQVKVTKVDPTQKTFEEYQKEKMKSKPVEEKKEEVKKPTTGIDVSQLFKSGPVSGDKKKNTTGNTKTKSVPKVTDKNDFPTLK